ncbi:hypothetical protein F8G81_18075 [Arthrobacter sp. CDRTa11]|uniref:hypothetical protein n=1 Tax=Arthrobacter sp. CDRTa11 TaxID=2651199 RepID=UPI002265B7A0|nr:hypothetical protein [Arthrobacter sp. CDRTa11]UZX04305.1 hypothetical protein F8G81_18075 [Arthrobacter sp. CDRTa11]
MKPAQVPGARLAIGAFVLTVLLGVGGASASALWEQSATATMTVTANGAWPGPALAGLTCTNDSPHKVATLAVTVSAAPATITYAALQASGNYGTSYTGSTILLPNGSANIVLTASPYSQRSQILKDNAAGPLTVRVTATYLDQTAAFMDVTLDNATANGKVSCPLAPVPVRH